MIFARTVSLDAPADLELAFARMGLPSQARQYLLEKIPHAQLLLTGLTTPDARFLRAAAESGQAPGREEFPAFVAGDQKSRPGSALLSGRRDQLDRLLARARDAGHAELAQAVSAALEPPVRTFELAGKTWDASRRTFVMGVVNVTPDSFSDGGRFFSRDDAVAQALRLVEAGAELLDVGGESTRPGAAEVPLGEELERVLPVLEALRSRTAVPLSIDTSKAEVARQALAKGAALVNDVTALGGDPKMAEVIAQANAACCLMHMQGTPRTMQQDPRYEDVVEEVFFALRERVAAARAAGIGAARILVDPGIGFGKTAGHNWMLLRRLQDLRSLGCAVVVGTSRKRFLGGVTGREDPAARVAATAGSVAAIAALGGCELVRVHDVDACRDAVAVGDALRTASEGGSLYLSSRNSPR